MNKYKIADMHTHSENSHDSICTIEDMCIAQINKGTSIFAVTDHFDTASFTDYDIFSPIKKAHETIGILNDKYKDKCRILSGIEISEGFWYPDIYQKAHDMTDFDVIVGSVHLVQHKNLDYAYSKINFSELEKSEVMDYLNSYFCDMCKMLSGTDFDILAHLTCPLRYINGKYNLNIDISHFENQITDILRQIIKRNIALEVNTSSFDVLSDFMPSVQMLKKYFDMGGYLITLGSDAHIAENASINFDKAVSTLKEIGFDGIYYYEKRKPQKIEI